MKRRIFGFQRLVRCPKWTPASRRSLSCTSLMNDASRRGVDLPPPSSVEPPSRDPGPASSGVCDNASLALRELEPLARPRLARLLPFHLARIARQQAALAQNAAKLRVVLQQGAGDPQTDRARLSRQTAAVDPDLHIETALVLRHDQRLLRMLLQREPRQVVTQRPPVDLPIPRARPEVDPRNTRLATARAVMLPHLGRHFRSPAAAVAAPRADASAPRTPAAPSASADPAWSWAAYP